MARRINKNTKARDSVSRNNHSLARRRLLQSLAIGGAFATAKSLPEQWTRPVVDAVYLPAHAQTSPTDRRTEVLSGARSLVLNEDGEFEFDRIRGRLRRALSGSGRDPRLAENIRVASAPAGAGSLLDYIVPPAEANEGITALVEAALEPDGRCTVNFRLNAEFDCDSSEETVSFSLNMCLQGQFDDLRAGETTTLGNACLDTIPGAEIVAIDDDSAVLSIPFPESDTRFDLTPGDVPECPDCEEEFEQFDELPGSCIE